ncbi:MAG: trypsin-like peptidase domain-containing protein [Leptospira sp.]|nr:trypsin-like peptidase domain-containing protein [Leptospira sp.]
MKRFLNFRILAIIGVSLLIGTFLTPIIYHGTQKGFLFLNAKDSEKSPAQIQAINLEQAFQEVFDKVSPSVVSIATERTVDMRNSPFAGDPFFEHFFGGGGRPDQSMKRKESGLGSGIILNDEGYILTNHHVVGGWDKFKVKLKNKEEYTAKLVGANKNIDLALLKISGAKNLKPAELGDSSKVRVGNWAIAIGAPLGFEQSFTVGVVSSVSRNNMDSSGLNYIQTDASINQGNSGGPLLDINGQVVGINRMIASQSGGSVGIGFAIPINEAKNVMDKLKSGKKITGTPFLGVGLDPVTDEVKDGLGLPNTKGALVLRVEPESPAESAGLRRFDVIVKIEDKETANPNDVINIVRNSESGKTISIEVIRGGKTMTFKAKLVESKNPN